MSFSRTWWGRRFLSELERFTDPARLARGRTYARNGKILRYTLKGTTITAQVRGSVNPYFGVYSEPIYTTTVTMTPIPKAQWQAAIATLSKRAGLVTRLLMNEMPDTIDDLFAESGLHLLPHDHREFVTRCSCPDWANPCKHVAGVYSLLAANLDRDPFLLFELRGLSRRELRRRLEESTLGRVLAESLSAKHPWNQRHHSTRHLSARRWQQACPRESSGRARGPCRRRDRSPRLPYLAC